MNNINDFRTEVDLLGKKEIPKDKLYGVHTQRAVDNFKLSNRFVHKELITGFGYVKLACAITNKRINSWNENKKADAIIDACREMVDGKLDSHIIVDALQGGAGTSTNMNVNEVIANCAIKKLGGNYGDYTIVSVLDDVNLHQSTNDTYPTAFKIALIKGIKKLLVSVEDLKNALINLSIKFDNVIKVGRTQMQGAVLIKLGSEMKAYSACIERDIDRLSGCIESLSIVNLGGTAIGTGIGAPKEFIKSVVNDLSDVTSLNLKQANDLIDATQNADVFSNLSAMLKIFSGNLIKISNDLRFMSSDQYCGIGEIFLPEMQAGSSIMAGKVNPVIPEAVIHSALTAISNDVGINFACSGGNLELNPFLPFVADCLLNSIDLLSNASIMFKNKCIDNIQANIELCEKKKYHPTAIITSLLPILGYDKTCEISKTSRATGKSVVEVIVENNILTKEEIDDFLSKSC